MKNYINIVTSFLTRIITSLCGFIVYGILSRNLSSDDFGVFTFTMVLISQLTILCTGGLFLISSKKIATLKKNILKIKIFESFFINLSLFSLIFFSLNQFTDVLNYLKINQLTLIIFCIVFVSSFHRIISDYFRAVNRFIYFSLFNSIGSGAGSLMWIFFTFSIITLKKQNLLSVPSVFTYYLISSISVTALFFLFHRNVLIRLSKLFRNISFSGYMETKNFLFQGYSLMLINITAGIINFFPAFYIFYFLSSEQTGSFLSAQKIAMLILVPLSIVDISIPQTISKNFDNAKFFLPYILKVSFIRFCMALPIFSSIILFPESIIILVYGQEFVHIESILKLLSISLVPAFILGPTRQLMTFTNNNLKLIFTDLTFIILTITLIIIFKNSIDFETFVNYYVLVNILRFSVYFIFCVYFFRAKSTFSLNFLKNETKN